MDRRTVLAIVLSTVIIIIWNVLVLEPRQRERRANLAAQDSLRAANAPAGEPLTAPAAAPEPNIASANGDSPTPAAPREGVLQPLAGAEYEQQISVESDLVVAKLSSRGARVKSLALIGFASHRGGNVDLIPDHGPGGFGLTLHTTEGDLPLDDFVFDVDQSRLILRPGERGAITFTGEPLPGLRVSKRFAMVGGTYDWGLQIGIDRSPEAPVVHSYTLDFGDGLAFTEKDVNQDRRFAAGAIGEAEGIRHKKIGSMKKPQDVLTREGQIEWAAITNKYFLVALAPDGAPPVDLSIGPALDTEAGLLTFAMTVPNRGGDGGGAASPGSWQSAVSVYTGPQEIRLLEASPLGLGGVVEYGWPILQPISQLLLKVLMFFYDLIHNYGIAIILISTATKLLFYKLSHQQHKSMRDMKKVQGDLEELRKKYKSDPQRLNKETMALYKKHGVNPMGGCLPMLLQMPVFFALYSVLNRTIELRGAPFMLWIHDLSAPDVLFHLPFELPFIGNKVCLLPIVMGLATFLQQRMTTMDPRQKAMMYMMPVFMTVIFFKFPSGLVLYWLTNTLLTIAQQYIIERKEKAPASALATSEAT